MLPDLHTDFSRVRLGGLVFPSLRIFHSLLWATVKGFGIVNKAEVDVFLELSCFFNDPTDVGNVISGSYAFSKSSFNNRKFTVHLLLKSGLENFEHCFASVWDECNCVVVWAFFGIGMKTDLFQSCGHCWVSQFAGILSVASSFRIWSSSTEIPSPPLALSVVMLPMNSMKRQNYGENKKDQCLPQFMNGGCSE